MIISRLSTKKVLDNRKKRLRIGINLLNRTLNWDFFFYCPFELNFHQKVEETAYFVGFQVCNKIAQMQA